MWGLITAGLSIASTLLQTKNARDSAREQKAAAKADAAQQLALMQAQALQISNQADQQKSETAIAVMRAKAAAAVAAAEGGVSGNSVGVIQNDIGYQGSKNLAQIEANKSAMLMQNKIDARGIAASSQSRINQINANTPTWLGAGLQIGAVGADRYMRWDASQNKPYTPRQT